MIEKTYDVVVVGSGPAGIGAALASARGGASTLLVEKNATIGGQMTSGLVTGFHGMRSHKGFEERGVGSYLTVARHTDLMTKGLALEICNRLAKEGGCYSEIDDPPMRVEFNPEFMGPVLFKLAQEFGLHILLDTFIFGVVMQGDKIDYIKAANKSGEVHIHAKQFIDCSADGDIAAWAGAPFVQGGEDGRCMPLTVYSILTNVNLDKLFDYYAGHPEDLHIGTIEGWRKLYEKGEPMTLIGLRSLVKKAAENGDYPRPLNCLTDIPYPIFDIQTSYLPKNTVKLLADMAYGIDITDGDQLSEAEMDMRMNQIPGIYRFMKKYVPGFENAELVTTAALIGTRESRRIIGKYTITKEDVLSNKESKHSVGRCGRAMNVHSSGGGDQSKPRGGQQWIESPLPTGFAIPYEALIPQKVDNLLVGGRCISVDRDALGSIRGEPSCMVTGEAAGEAAALCVLQGVSPSSLDIKKLQETLVSHNVVL